MPSPERSLELAAEAARRADLKGPRRYTDEALQRDAPGPAEVDERIALLVPGTGLQLAQRRRPRALLLGEPVDLEERYIGQGPGKGGRHADSVHVEEPATPGVIPALGRPPAVALGEIEQEFPLPMEHPYALPGDGVR